MVALKPKHPWWQIRRRVLVPVVLLLLIAAFLGGWTMWMPGKSYRGALAPLTVPQQALAEALAHDVKRLSQDIGERNAMRHKALIAAADHIRESFKTAGYRIDQQDYQVAGLTFSNLTVQITGTKAPNEIVVIGAHYDSIDGSPGANDNATGVAALLALARSFAGKNCDRTLRFAAFVNEEPPCFQTQDMGSLVYARRCKQRNENIVAMISFDGLGYYNDEPNSQSYPFPFSLFYPSQGNFIAFVGNMSSRSLVHRAIGTFRRRTRFPSEGAAMPAALPGAGWSDHWSFWQQGYQAVMVTDTLPFRYPHYHTQVDLPASVDFERMARVADGLAAVIADLAEAK